MKFKLIRLSFILLCSTILFLLAGSMPIPAKPKISAAQTELQKLNNSAKKHLNLNFSHIHQKNPLIFLEFSVE